MRPTDLELLKAFACNGNDAAFTRLVRRHSGWVSASARQRLGEDHLADDATQAVFMVLATRASQLVETNRRSISAWIFNVMHLTCGRLRRTRVRQQRHEYGAAMVRASGNSDLPEADLCMLLEDAIAQLPQADREAVVRRFYEAESFSTVGAVLGTSAEAARKRVGRALKTVRGRMLQDGLDVIPDELLAAMKSPRSRGRRFTRSVEKNVQVNSIAKGAITMMQQIDAIDFSIWSAEFQVEDVEANLDFFEKLGFRRHFMDAPDAKGRISRASLQGGSTARIWLRRAAKNKRTAMAGSGLFLWIDGGANALTAHRDAIAAQGVKVSAFNDDISLRNFTVETPDGYSIGFFTAFR